MIKPKFKLIKDNWLLRKVVFSSVRAITIAPFGIYFRDEKIKTNPRITNHEMIHWEQQIEFLCFFFVLYLLEFIIKGLFGSGRAYLNLAAEREAYLHDNDLNYLKIRKRYAWLKYIFKKP